MPDSRPYSNAAGTWSQDNLFAGDYPVNTDSITLASGQNLVRGSVLGRVTSSGKWVLSTSGASDGSQNPAAILAEDTNATSADTITTVYLSGDFNERALTFGASHTAASTKQALRALSIYLKDSVAK